MHFFISFEEGQLEDLRIIEVFAYLKFDRFALNSGRDTFDSKVKLNKRQLKAINTRVKTFRYQKILKNTNFSAGAKIQ